MILVVGATGRLGGDIALRLLAQGRPVRVLLRQNSPAEEMAKQGLAVSPKDLLAAGAEAVYGDLKDRASLDAAVAGVETVITTANSALRGGDDNPVSIELQGNRNLIDAARAAGVDHFIFISVIGFDPHSPNPFMAGKAQTEEHLINSGMHYTILAPEIFAEVWVGLVIGIPLSQNKPITLVAPASHRHTFVSMRDVAAYAVAAVDHPSARDKRIPVAGPEALSWQDVVAKASGTLGRALEVNLVQPGQPIPFLPPGVDQLMIAGEQYESVIEMERLSETFGVPPTPIDEVMRAMFARA
jgi:NADH dehydrogenase